MFSYIYYNLCESKRQDKSLHIKGSNIHRHHIIPTHSGGTNIEDNYTYLTVREHILAHYLLWKMHGNPNDLRAMKMLGAKLTYIHRKILGEYCRDNKIGFFAASKEQRNIWRQRGLETQKLNNDTNSFYYWSTPEGRAKRASMGGKQTKLNGTGRNFSNMDPTLQRKICSAGGKAHVGKIAITNGTRRRRVKPEDLDDWFAQGYIRGFTLFSSDT